MGTVLRPEISKNNKYWISKHRQYELKHFCLQYHLWKREYDLIYGPITTINLFERVQESNFISDPTSKAAIRRAYVSERIQMVERAAMDTDPSLYSYILKAVTEGMSYSTLKFKFNMPCSKDTYYELYRKFFWILDKVRD